MRLRLGIPNTIFAEMFVSVFPKEFFAVSKHGNHVLLELLTLGEIDLALIPSLEIIGTDNLFVSEKFGIAFDGPVSDDYIYFPKDEKNLAKVGLTGNVSMNEIVLSKVIFRENYNLEIEQKVLSTLKDVEDTTLISSGDINLANDNYTHGESFSELVAEFIDAPYLKFALVSTVKENIEFVNNQIAAVEEQLEIISKSVLNKAGFSRKTVDFITGNFNSVYFEITEIEKNGYEDLRKIPFYYGLVEEVKEIAFV